MNPISDEQIILLLTQKLAFHEAEVKKYKNALSSLNGGPLNTNVNSATKPKEGEIKGVFTNVILSYLNEGIPMNSRELMNRYLTNSGRDIAMNNFSSRLIKMKNGGRIKVHTFDENPHSTRQYYGLPDWFNGEKLKPEYLKKIKKPE